MVVACKYSRIFWFFCSNFSISHVWPCSSFLFLIFEVIFETSVKNCIDLYTLLIGFRFHYRIILGQKVPKTCFFQCLTLNDLQLHFKLLFHMILIGKAIPHMAEWCLDFVVALIGFLMTATSKILLLASYSKIGFSQAKFHCLRILMWYSESA
jgi:hypothetical protein